MAHRCLPEAWRRVEKRDDLRAARGMGGACRAPRRHRIARCWIPIALALMVATGISDAWAQGGRDNVQRFRDMPPQERQQILEDFQRWNELPESRRGELQEAYRRFQQLPPERRNQIMNRFRQFQALPPDEQQRILENQERWQRLPPAERQRIRERFQQMTPEERQQVQERLRNLPPPESGPGTSRGLQGAPRPQSPPPSLYPGAPPLGPR